MRKMLGVILAVMVVGCTGGGTLPPSAQCEETSECDDGLECLSFGVFEQSDACMVVAKTCSTPCETNADCAPLGSTFMCFATCDQTKNCQDTTAP